MRPICNCKQLQANTLTQIYIYPLLLSTKEKHSNSRVYRQIDVFVIGASCALVLGWNIQHIIHTSNSDMGQAESRQEQFWEACGFGDADKVQQLIEEGIDVNWVSKTHDSSPIHAASQGKPEIIKMLLKAECDVNARDERQCTALHHASMNGFTLCAKLLLEAGAVVNAQDKNSWSCLHNAAYWAHADVTELLLSYKADVTLQNKDKRLAIHEVARSRKTNEEEVSKTAQLLILAGSDVEARAGSDGFSDFTVLMAASYHGHTSVVSNLLQARCEVNAQSSDKWTALHWAADRSHADIVELLLKNDADVTIVGERGETARDRAKEEDIREIFDKFDNVNSQPEPHCTDLSSNCSTENEDLSSHSHLNDVCEDSGEPVAGDSYSLNASTGDQLNSKIDDKLVGEKSEYVETSAE